MQGMPLKSLLCIFVPYVYRLTQLLSNMKVDYFSIDFYWEEKKSVLL